jgi:carboxylesterase
LLVHGLGGGPFELEPLRASLSAAGRRVAIPTLPGHEASGSIMPPSRWQDWYDTVEHHFDELASDGQPVAVIGFSTGGTLSIRLSLRRPVARLVLLAPFLAIRYARFVPVLKPEQYLRWLARVMPDLPRKAPPIRDPQARRAFAANEQFRTFSVPATLSALELIRLVEPQIPELHQPTLILQGRLDSVVDPKGATTIYRQLGSRNASLVWLPRSDHLVALDYDRDRVLKEVHVFLAARD